MIEEMQSMIDKYVAWLKDKTSLRQLDDWIEITTPYLDRHNDYLSVKFTGKSGYDHLFDFVIPKSRQSPERVLQTINRPSRDTAQALAFSWKDTKELRRNNLNNSWTQSVHAEVSKHEQAGIALRYLRANGFQPLSFKLFLRGP